MGRYPEDVYFNGNPWYLNTLAAAEQLYDALYVWNKQGSITVTSISLPFFKDFSSSVTAGTYASGSSTYTTLYNAIQTYADGYVSVIAKYTPSNGSLSEQFDKNSGTPLSANDLTWSYASFLTAAARRAGIVPSSWIAVGSNAVPGTCAASAVSGSYTSATATSFPANQTPATGVPTTTGSCPTATSVAVTFNEKVTTSFGQTIKIVGDAAALGSWNTGSAIALSAAKYTSSNPLWTVTLNLPAGEVIQYKYINVQSDGTVDWEADPNHTYTVPVSCATAVTQADTWQS